ncbi:ribosome-binding protein 1 isoform X2 [Ceratitis capitata]|uniref:ribosome-binding protein 1 isoform X2 n=1 Tax=Ceratitis capitata TaxID=7213 RepID=UPI000A11790C|nr:ribosome-binding protein 1 isoform X2 [Ceratitis capitata]
MVFDLNTTNNLPQSSTSSCTDYFFDGCQSKSQNNCQSQYQNCQCRPCCVNSMINDHTYSLLKKICRKVIRDYHRQKSREKYTIFDGGNSINVRIHRSSVGEAGICQHLNGASSFSTIAKTGRKDVAQGKDVRESKYEDRREGRKDGSISDKSGKGAGSKKHGEKEKLRKSQYDISDTKRAKKKRSKEQDYDDDDSGKNGKGRKGKQKDIDEQSVNGKGRKGIRGKGVEDEDDFDGMGKHDKGRKYKSPKQSAIGDDEASARKKGKGKTTTDADKERSSKSGKEGHGRKQKGSTGDGDEDDGDSFNTKIRKEKSEKDKRARGSRDEDRTLVKTKLDKSKNKEREDNEESGTVNEGKRKQGNDQKDRAIGSAATEKFDGKKKPRDDNTADERNYEDMGQKKGHFGSARGDHDGSRDGKDPESKGKSSREKRITNRYQELKDNQRASAKDFADGDHLRTKVRKGHAIIPVHKTSISKDIYRLRSIQDERIKMRVGKRGKKQYSKGIKDDINERRGARRRRKYHRSSRGFGGRFGAHRVHRTGMTSRCDEIRPCDILRAHMEQRELCERQRCCCMPCSCDCSAVYCRNPSTICSRIC